MVSIPRLGRFSTEPSLWDDCLGRFSTGDHDSKKIRNDPGRHL